MLARALQGLTKLVNRYLRLDLEAPQRLKKLAGKSVRIEIQGFAIIFYIVVTDQQIEFTTQAYSADITMRGTPTALLGLLKSRHAVQIRDTSTLNIQGDIQIAQQLQALFVGLNIDWEEYASQWIGDAAAYQLFNTVRKLRHWVKRTNVNMRHNFVEYIQEEMRYFPPRAELEDFYQAVDHVRDDTERLTIRIARLQEKTLSL